MAYGMERKPIPPQAPFLLFKLRATPQTLTTLQGLDELLPVHVGRAWEEMAGDSTSFLTTQLLG